MSDDSDRKFEPTPRRRDEFRKEGRIARARDAGGIAAAAAVLAVLLGTRDASYRAMEQLFVHCHGDLTAITRGEGPATFRGAATALIAIAAPAAIAAALAGATIGATQAGLRFDAGSLFKFERLNPGPRIKQLFGGRQALFETAFAMMRVGIVGYLAYTALKAELPVLLGLTSTGAEAALASVGDAMLRLVMKCLGGLLLLSVADYAHSRFTLEKQLKMTLVELKQETRSQDGDPKVKARIRARARALARRRALNDVKKADVVVTNPTHVAVALRYGAKDAAPVVIAKGHDEIAIQIRTTARGCGIPIVESRVLARTLDAEVPVGHPIQAAHFAAVAQVLAFVYRLKGRAARRRA